jgi:hypothetical protein
MPPVIQARLRPVSIRPASFKIKSGPPFGLTASWHPGCESEIFSNFFLIFSAPREVHGIDNFDLAFGFTQLEIAGTDRAVTPVSMGSSTSRGHRNATPALRRSEISRLTVMSLFLK